LLSVATGLAGIPRSVVVVSAVPVMEQVHQRAGEQQQVRQHAERVGAVFGEQQNPGDSGESPKDQPRTALTARPYPAFTFDVSRMIVHDLAPLSVCRQ
jgi:hypothetical protein